MMQGKLKYARGTYPWDGVWDKHWYKQYVEECPLCGHSTEYRERIYGDKPTERADRFDFSQVWCGCES